MMNNEQHYQLVAKQIKKWGQELGFRHIGISEPTIKRTYQHVKDWVNASYHGEMHWLEKHHELRADPQKLLPGTQAIICATLDYLPPRAGFAANLKNQQSGYISRYALGRDYHSLMRLRLKKLAEKIKIEFPTLQYRPFVDSAPVLERELAYQAGLGWVGKHTLILTQQSGSLFFLGELFVNIPLPADKAIEDKCGRCQACITICPTQAIIAPYKLNATRCISYLTIEHQGVIPEALRPLIGNRIYGCDDCQLICPWNRYAKITQEHDFFARPALQQVDLITLFSWNEQTFEQQTQGSAIRRIGYFKWLRNIAIALGNAPYSEENVLALAAKKGISPLIDEHIDWAIAQQKKQASQNSLSIPSRQKLLIRSIEKGLPFTESPDQ